MKNNNFKWGGVGPRKDHEKKWTWPTCLAKAKYSQSGLTGSARID